MRHETERSQVRSTEPEVLVSGLVVRPGASQAEMPPGEVPSADIVHLRGEAGHLA